MPRAVDPTERFVVVLASDAAMDLSVQPRFLYHYLTAREHRQLGRLNEKLLAAESIDEVADATFEAVRLGLVDWENLTDRDGVHVPYNPDLLEDLVGLIEAQELVNQIARQSPGLVSVEDKKKQGSPSDSGTEKSAKTADRESA